MPKSAIAALIAAGLTLAACGGEGSAPTNAASAASPNRQDLPQGSEPVKLDPAEFTLDIHNPYWSMRPDSDFGRSALVSYTPAVTAQSPSGASSDFFPSKAKNSRSRMSNVLLFGPKRGWNAVSRTIEKRLPSIARWKVSATMRAPAPLSLPPLSSASRRM